MARSGDVFTKSKRSEVMSRIRGKDTKPEVALRKALFARGLRYRLHPQGIPGRPDMVFPRHRAVVFVNGCFWHGHACPAFRWPRQNAAFWRRKIEGNMRRDRAIRRRLRAEGWRVRTVWECSIRRRPAGDVERLALRLRAWVLRGAG